MYRNIVCKRADLPGIWSQIFFTIVRMFFPSLYS